MFCTVKVSSALRKGDVVSWGTNSFTLASSLASPLGVLSEDATLDDDSSVYYAPVIFAGIAWATSSQNIPDEGGELQIQNGRVYVDNNANGAGIIAPLSRGQTSRSQGEMVMIHIR
jgi:hypothetical protein